MNYNKTNKKFGNFMSYIRHTLLPIIVYGIAIGLVTGAVVWGFAYVVEKLNEHSVQIYTYV